MGQQSPSAVNLQTEIPVQANVSVQISIVSIPHLLPVASRTRPTPPPRKPEGAAFGEQRRAAPKSGSRGGVAVDQLHRLSPGEYAVLEGTRNGLHARPSPDCLT